MTDDYEIAVDFMDLSDDRRLWATSSDVRDDLDLSIGRHVVVGDEDADPRIARIVAVDAAGNVQLEVLPGLVERLRGRGDVAMSTDEIMLLTRDD